MTNVLDMKCSHYHLAIIVLAIFSTLAPSSSIQAENANSPRFSDGLKIKPISADAPKGFDKIFSKQVEVFGIKIYGSKETEDAKILHAAHVMAEYLDNDENGRPDNPLVVKKMVERSATLVMFSTEREAERAEEKLFGSRSEVDLDKMVLQGLWGEETIPPQSKSKRFDATLEEVLHLITHAGYAHAYPKVFGEKAGSKIADAMDVARGGRHKRVPRRYPEKAWYTYDDRTCDYGCQVTEYFYWGLTSLLGAQSSKSRFNEIRHEWRLNTKEKLKAGDKLLYKLLTDPKYALPKKLPDGKYSPTK